MRPQTPHKHRAVAVKCSRSGFPSNLTSYGTPSRRPTRGRRGDVVSFLCTRLEGGSGTLQSEAIDYSHTCSVVVARGSPVRCCASPMMGDPCERPGPRGPMAGSRRGASRPSGRMDLKGSRLLPSFRENGRLVTRETPCQQYSGSLEAFVTV